MSYDSARVWVSMSRAKKACDARMSPRAHSSRTEESTGGFNCLRKRATYVSRARISCLCALFFPSPPLFSRVSAFFQERRAEEGKKLQRYFCSRRMRIESLKWMVAFERAVAARPCREHRVRRGPRTTEKMVTLYSSQRRTLILDVFYFFLPPAVNA